MTIARLTWMGAFLLSGLLRNAPAIAQNVTLTTDCEVGFRRFIHMAGTGQLGADVTNANVGAFGDHARVELLRRDAPPIVLRLDPKRSAQPFSRYFDIELGEHAAATDAARVGRALDECFTQDPFQFLGLEELVADGPIPRLADAWSYAGVPGVVRVLERRMMVHASLGYTIGVIVAVAFATLASVILLCGSPPPRGAGRAC